MVCPAGDLHTPASHMHPFAIFIRVMCTPDPVVSSCVGESLTALNSIWILLVCCCSQCIKERCARCFMRQECCQ